MLQTQLPKLLDEFSSSTISTTFNDFQQPAKAVGQRPGKPKESSSNYERANPVNFLILKIPIKKALPIMKELIL